MRTKTSKLSKKSRKTHSSGHETMMQPMVYIGLGVLSLFIVVVTVLVVRFKTPQALTSPNPLATLQYTEDFTTTTFKSAGASLSEWDTTRGVLTLPRTSTGLYNADEVTPGTQVVYTNDASLVQQPVAVEYDRLGQPYVAFMDYEFDRDTTQIFFGHWDREVGAWAKTTNVPGFDAKGSTKLGGMANMDLLSTDEPAVVWAELDVGTATHSYHYTRWDNDKQAFVKADGTLGSDIFFTNSAGGPISSSGERSFDLVHDSQDRPNISFTMWDSTGGDSETAFLRWDGRDYVPLGPTVNISNNTGDTAMPAAGAPIKQPEMVLDSADRPFIIWIDNTPGNEELFMVYGDNDSGVWRDITGAAYSEACLSTTCSATNLSQTSTFTYPGDISMSTNGEPIVAWADSAPSSIPEIYYQRWNQQTKTWLGADGSAGPQLVTSSVTGVPQAGVREVSVRLDTRDYPVIAFAAPDAFLSVDLFVTRWNGSTFATVDRSTAGATNVSLQGSTGLGFRQPRLQVDGLGNPGVIWTSAGAGPSILEFTRFIEPCVESTTVDSLTVLSSDEPIVSATLDVTDTPYGGDIVYQLSNDDGQTYYEVTPGGAFTFPTVGSDIKWRVGLTRGSTVGACPLVTSLSIDATTVPVVRIDGTTPVEQAINVSKLRFPVAGSSPVGLLARDDIFADALTISPLVNRTGGTILLNDSAMLLPEVLTELERALGPGTGQTVYIAGQTEAQSAAVEQALSAAGFTPKRLGDSNRIGTAARIAEEIVALNPSPTTKVFLAEHALFADALVAGAVAGDVIMDNQADPILLAERGQSSLDDFTRDFLEAHPDVTAVEIIGGEEALPAGLVSTLTDIGTVATIDRSAGQDRFATAVALMQKHVTGPTNVVVANGQKSGLP
ncbi:MAG: cell wall-binding repeat-containing protein, partial [bacterium]|nr:cell wall-binding repeat-containing protein [bacterium]